MRRRFLAILVSVNAVAMAAIIDQIAIVVNRAIIKDSDIDRNLRATDFLNGQPLNLSNAARKEAASRLIDQVFIRREVALGDYPNATPAEAEQQLQSVKKDRYKTDAAFEAALKRYGLTQDELQAYFRWQLTVLRFITQRFKPAVLLTDNEIEAYYKAHLTALQREHPGHASLEDVREEIENVLTGERVNQLFFSWLDEQRKETKIDFHEESLK